MKTTISPRTLGYLGAMLAAVSLGAVACSSASTSDTSSGASSAESVSTQPTLPADYETWRGVEKQDYLWNLMEASDYHQTGDGTLAPWPKLDLFTLGKLAVLDLTVTADRVSDELPEGRVKLVHAIGAEAEVELIPDADSTQTGMLAGGLGIARLSCAKAPDSSSFVPAIALKMFADGQPSQNVESMLSIDGQGTDYDFFANSFSNVIPPAVGAASKIVVLLFSKVSSNPANLLLGDFTSHDASGTTLDPSVAVVPFQIWFQPTAEIAAVARDSVLSTDFRDDLAKIPANTPIYDILVAQNEGDPKVHVARLFTRTKVIASAYGDEKLFFKHQVTPL